jgi:hypothetical protein
MIGTMTPKQRKNIYARATGGDEKGIVAGSGQLLDECKRLNVNHAWVICPQKGTFSGGHMEAALGTDRAKEMAKGESITANGVTLVRP